MTKTKSLCIQTLCKFYGSEPVWKDLTLSFLWGKRYALMAPSGAGKTTLFRILLGLEQPDSGSISGCAGVRRAAVFQEDRLLEGATALENLRFVTGTRYSRAFLEKELLRLLPQEALQKPVREFSGGMKRRTAILRALLAPSDLILMDEPFTGLDRERKQAVAELIWEYTEGKLLLFSTHHEEDAALVGAERVYF